MKNPIHSACSLVRLASTLVLLGSLPAYGDVAADHGSHVYLYFVDGGTLHRTLCQDSSVLYDRGACRDQEEVVSFASVMTKTVSAQGAGLDQVLLRIDEYYVKIQRTDNMMLEIIAGSPDPGSQQDLATLREEIERRNADIVQLKNFLGETAAQIARVEAALAQGPDNNLVLQLAQLHQSQQSLAGQLQTKTEALAQLRDQFIRGQAHLISSDVFNSLQQQRDGYVATLRSLIVNRDRLQTQIRDGYLFEDMVTSQTGTYEIMQSTPGFEGEKPLAASLFRVFQDELIARAESEKTTTTSRITTLNGQIAQLEGEFGADYRLIQALQTAARTTYVEPIVVAVWSASTDQFCSDSSGGQNVTFNLPIYSAPQAGDGYAAIGTMAEELLHETATTYRPWRTQSSCFNYFATNLPWAWKLAAEIQLHNQYGQGTCVKATQGFGTNCQAYHAIFQAWDTYSSRGGETWGRNTERKHLNNVTAASVIRNGDLAAAQATLGRINARLADLRAAQ